MAPSSERTSGILQVAGCLLPLIPLLTGCGGSTRQPAALAPQPGMARPAWTDPAPATLLDSLGGRAGPGGSVRTGSALGHQLAGAAYTRASSGSGPAPGAQDTLRLKAGEGEHAFAAYSLPPLAPDYAGLPSRVQIDIQRAAGTGPAQAEGLEYYVGISDYTLTRWDWRGPFNSSYTVLLNSAALRDRYFDLNGSTSLVVMLPAPASGATAAADVRSIGIGYDGLQYPVRPYRPDISGASLVSELQFNPWVYAYQAANTFTWTCPAGTAPFDSLDAVHVGLLRQSPDETAPRLLGTYEAAGMPAGTVTFSDSLSQFPDSPVPPPGRPCQYRLRLANAAGETAATGPVEVQTLLGVPDLTAYSTNLGVSLAWHRQLGVDGYELWRDGVLRAAFEPGDSSFSDLGMPPGIPASYVLRAFAGQAQAECLPVGCTPDINAPQWLRCQPGTAAIELEWYSFGYDDLALYRDGGLLATLDSAATSYADTDATPGQLHTYTLRGNYNSLYKESLPVTEARWRWPVHLLAPNQSSSLTASSGQLADLGGHPALMTGCWHGATSAFGMWESAVSNPSSAGDWSYSTHEVPGLEPGSGAQSTELNQRRDNFAVIAGQPACAMSSEWASLFDYNIALTYREQNQLPPLPPSMLGWKQSWCPVQSFLDALCLREVNNRPALAWRDEYSLLIHYARSSQLQPGNSSDWIGGPVTAGNAQSVRLSSTDWQAALLIREFGYITALYIANQGYPASQADWTRIPLAGSESVDLDLQNIGGRLWAVYTENGAVRLARAATAAPASIADFAISDLPLDLAAASELRLREVNGRAAGVFQLAYPANASGQTSYSVNLLLANTPLPAGPADWEVLLCDAHGQRADLAVSGGTPLLAYAVDTARREAGWHIMPLPPDL